MAYTPTSWETGDVITAEKLNKAENGIAASEAFVVPVSYDDETYTMTLDASWNELYANKNRLVLAVYESEDNDGNPVVYPMYLTCIFVNDGTYSATFIMYSGEANIQLQSTTFTASSADADLTVVD